MSAANAERERGIACYNRGRHARALGHFRKSLALGKADPETLCFIGYCLDSSGSPREAAKAFSSLMARFPEYIPGYLGAAKLARARGEFAPAEKLLRRALSRRPGDSSAEVLLRETLGQAADSYRTAGMVALSEAALTRLLKINPRDSSVRLKLAGMLRLQGKTERAQSMIEGLEKLDFRAGLASGEEFRALMKLSRYREAFRLAESILENGPSASDLAAFWDPWEWGSMENASAREREAQRLRRLLAADRESPWILYYLASLRGDPESIERLEAAVSGRRVRYAWMYLKIGWAHLMSGRFAEAAAALKTSLEQESLDWRAHGYLAEAYLCQGARGLAFRELDRALAAAPEREAGQVLAWRGAVELWTGSYRKALGHLERACALGSQHAFCWRGAALLQLGRPARALERLDETVRLFPHDLEAYVWRGEAKRALGLNREALADLSRKPVRLWALFNRALARGALKDFAGMRRDFKDISPEVTGYIAEKLRLDPSDEPAILEGGLRLARGFRRQDYRQKIWMAR